MWPLQYGTDDAGSVVWRVVPHNSYAASSSEDANDNNKAASEFDPYSPQPPSKKSQSRASDHHRAADADDDDDDADEAVASLGATLRATTLRFDGQSTEGLHLDGDEGDAERDVDDDDDDIYDDDEDWGEEGDDDGEDDDDDVVDDDDEDVFDEEEDDAAAEAAFVDEHGMTRRERTDELVEAMSHTEQQAISLVGAQAFGLLYDFLARRAEAIDEGRLEAGAFSCVFFSRFRRYTSDLVWRFLRLFARS